MKHFNKRELLWERSRLDFSQVLFLLMHLVLAR